MPEKKQASQAPRAQRVTQSLGGGEQNVFPDQGGGVILRKRARVYNVINCGSLNS